MPGKEMDENADTVLKQARLLFGRKQTGLSCAKHSPFLTVLILAVALIVAAVVLAMILLVAVVTLLVVLLVHGFNLHLWRYRDSFARSKQLIRKTGCLSY